MAHGADSVTAFLGATGGCGLNALVKTLQHGLKAVARASLTKFDALLIE
jgi:hypothetical protein